MLKQIDPLPSAKDQPARGNRNAELRLRERGSNMCRHIVGTFGAMNVALAVFRRDRLEKSFQIRPDIGIGILLDEKRGGGMAAEDCEQAGRDLFPGQPSGQLRGDLDKAFAAGLNVQGMERLPHKIKINEAAGPHQPANESAVTSAIFCPAYCAEPPAEATPGNRPCAS